jgi:hypothetical protein
VAHDRPRTTIGPTLLLVVVVGLFGYDTWRVRDERSGLEPQRDQGDNVSTEDLRVALQRHRSFFERLLKL